MAIRSLKTGSLSRSAQAGNTMIFPGSYESIATTVVGAGGTSTVTFSSIPSTYQHLQLRIMLRDTGTVADWNGVYLTFNGDTATNYSYHTNRFYGDTPSIYPQGFATQANIQIGLLPSSAASYGSTYGVMVVDVLDYGNVNKYKTTRTLGGSDANSATYGWVAYNSGNWRSTTAVNTIAITATGRTIAQNSHFALYGVK